MSVPGLTVVSFFTDTWEYPDHARRLAKECDALGLTHHIVRMPDTGSYLGNTRLKPSVIRAAMLELQRPLLWLDVDASILRPPTALRADVDFMAYPMAPTRDRKWHVGTLYFNATPAALDLLTMWCETAERGSDEAALDAVWRTGRWTGRSAELPQTYHHIGVAAPLESGTVVLHRLSNSDSKRALKKRVAARKAAGL